MKTAGQKGIQSLISLGAGHRSPYIAQLRRWMAENRLKTAIFAVITALLLAVVVASVVLSAGALLPVWGLGLAAVAAGLCTVGMMLLLGAGMILSKTKKMKNDQMVLLPFDASVSSSLFLQRLFFKPPLVDSSFCEIEGNELSHSAPLGSPFSHMNSPLAASVSEGYELKSNQVKVKQVQLDFFCSPQYYFKPIQTVEHEALFKEMKPC